MNEQTDVQLIVEAIDRLTAELSVLGWVVLAMGAAIMTPLIVSNVIRAMKN